MELERPPACLSSFKSRRRNRSGASVPSVSIAGEVASSSCSIWGQFVSCCARSVPIRRLNGCELSAIKSTRREVKTAPSEDDEVLLEERLLRVAVWPIFREASVVPGFEWRPTQARYAETTIPSRPKKMISPILTKRFTGQKLKKIPVKDIGVFTDLGNVLAAGQTL